MTLVVCQRAGLQTMYEASALNEALWKLSDPGLDMPGLVTLPWRVTLRQSRWLQQDRLQMTQETCKRSGG